MANKYETHLTLDDGKRYSMFLQVMRIDPGHE